MKQNLVKIAAAAMVIAVVTTGMYLARNAATVGSPESRLQNQSMWSVVTFLLESLVFILVGDEPYYARCGFKRIPKGAAKMPGPVDPARLLVAELTDGAFAGVSGAILPEWERA